MSDAQSPRTPSTVLLRRLLVAGMLGAGASATLSACLFAPVIADETPPAAPAATAPAETTSPAEHDMTRSTSDPSTGTPTPTPTPTPTSTPASAP